VRPGILRTVDRVKIGNTFRAIRVELRLRQADVAERAGVSQQTVSAVERGMIGSMPTDTLARVASALQADLELTLRWRGPKLARLLDRRHAALQNAVVSELTASGWQTVAEETFNHFGDRGSVDILGWLPGPRALLIVEIKSEIVDLQDMLHSIAVKERVVPGLVRKSRMWQPRVVATVVVLPATSTHRRAVAGHAALLSASLPARTVQVREWIRRPSGALRGLWFFPCTPGTSVVEAALATRRVNKPAGRPERPNLASKPHYTPQSEAPIGVQPIESGHSATIGCTRVP
jgi:transcriptional regulator with XRE-family HTH domain